MDRTGQVCLVVELKGEPGQGAPNGRIEALPQTPPGGKPPETPPPFACQSIFQNGGDMSRVRRPRKNCAPLTAPLRSETQPNIRQRGAQDKNTPTLNISLDLEWPSHGRRDR